MDSYYAVKFNKDIQGMEYYDTRKTYFHKDGWGELSEGQVNDLLSKGWTVYWGGYIAFKVEDDFTINISDIDKIVRIDYVPEKTMIYNKKDKVTA